MKPNRIIITAARGILKSAIWLLYQAGMTWTEAEAELGLIPMNGMNAWRRAGNKHAEQK